MSLETRWRRFVFTPISTRPLAGGLHNDENRLMVATSANSVEEA